MTALDVEEEGALVQFGRKCGITASAVYRGNRGTKLKRKNLTKVEEKTKVLKVQ